MQDSPFTWHALATLGGASLLTFLVVGYTKRLADRYWPWGTDLYAVLVAAVILVVAQIAGGASAADWRTYVLAAFNGFVVAATAGKLHDKTLQDRDRRDREGAM